MRLEPERRRQLALLLAALLAIGLAVFGGWHLSRWLRHEGAPPVRASRAYKRVPLSEAPPEVREAAARLAGSRVVYPIPWGDDTYLVISTGEGGERVRLREIRPDAAHSGHVSLHLQSDPGGDRLLIAGLYYSLPDARRLRVLLDGYGGALPLLVNPDAVPLTALPAAGALVVVSPEAGVRISGHSVQVTGFVRLPSGRFSVQLFAAGKGRTLGESLGVAAAAGAPDWGSFRINVPFTLPPGLTEGVVLVYDEASGAKVAVRVLFGRQ